MASIESLVSSIGKVNQERWQTVKLTKENEFIPVAKRLTAPSAKMIYQEIEASTGVPWWFIAVVHEREASQNWNSNLGQGDPWNHVTIHVPKGRGPFKSFKEAAIDALTNCAPWAARNKDWSIGRLLAYLELYNGAGYFYKGRPSPYIWAGTNIYVSGKYVADGVYDPNKVDTQLGCAGLLLAMAQLDDSIKLGESNVTHVTPEVVIIDKSPVVVPPVIKPEQTPVPVPVKTSWIEALLQLITNLFKKK